MIVLFADSAGRLPVNMWADAVNPWVSSSAGPGPLPVMSKVMRTPPRSISGMARSCQSGSAGEESAQRVAEPCGVGGEPGAASVEAGHPAHRLPHLDEVGVAALDPPADELATPLDARGERIEQLIASAGQPVGVGDEAQALLEVGRPPTEADAALVVDRDAHPGELRQVVRAAAG